MSIDGLSTRWGLIALAALALAGCDRGIDLSNASLDDVAEATKGATKQKAGMWDVSTEVEALDLGAMGDAATAAQLKRQMGQKRTNRACLTDAEASVIGIPGPGAKGSARCRFDRFRMSGGMLDATMRCSLPGDQMIVTQKGSYAETSYDLRSTVKQSSGGEGTGTSMTMHVTGNRVGDCKRAGPRGESK